MTADQGAARYALYFAPVPDTPLHRFGSAWLGRDAATGRPVPQPEVPGVTPERLAEITRPPALYGFHATLKPPFRLAGGCSEAGLLEAVAALAGERQPFAAPALTLAVIDGWRALVLQARCPEMQALCDEMVAALDPFRRPPDEAELARRLAAGLTPRQEALLRRWGYPYVFDEFRFHMTLTSRLDAAEGARIDAALAALAAPHLCDPLAVDGVALFRQPGPGEPFRLLRRFPFAA